MIRCAYCACWQHWEERPTCSQCGGPLSPPEPKAKPDADRTDGAALNYFQRFDPLAQRAYEDAMRSNPAMVWSDYLRQAPPASMFRTPSRWITR